MKVILWILGGIAVFFLVFGLGIAVGYSKAMFAVRWDANYPHNFYAAQGAGPFNVLEPAPWNTHGVAGVIIDVASGTISVRDVENNERSVVILPETVIRAMEGTISADGIDLGDQITAIGEPNPQGQLIARFIRVIAEPTSSPDAVPPAPIPN